MKEQRTESGHDTDSLTDMQVMRQSDVYQDWKSLLSWSRITDECEGTSEGRSRRLTVNLLFALYLTHVSLRMGFTSYIVSESYVHWFGNTFVKTGNAAYLVFSGVGSAFAMLCLYRFVAAYQVMKKDDLYYLRAVLSIIDEPNDSLRQRKLKMARLVYVCAMLGCLGYIVTATTVVTYLMYINVHGSASETEQYCWLFWWLIDLASCVAALTTLAPFPATWMLIALSYRLDLLHLSASVMTVKASTPDADADRESVARLIRAITSLSRKAEQVNHSCSPILFVMVLCSLPFACSVMFVTLYSDQIVIAAAYALIGSNMMLFSLMLQAIAGDISRKSESVWKFLPSIARRHLLLHQRMALLKLMEESASDHQPLALYTVTGQRYTITSFLSYVMEVVVHFSLLITFSNYLLQF